MNLWRYEVNRIWHKNSGAVFERKLGEVLNVHDMHCMFMPCERSIGAFFMAGIRSGIMCFVDLEKTYAMGVDQMDIKKERSDL